LIIIKNILLKFFINSTNKLKFLNKNYNYDKKNCLLKTLSNDYIKNGNKLFIKNFVK